MYRLFYIPKGKSQITMTAYYILTNMSDNILNILWSISYRIFKNRKQMLKFENTNEQLGELQNNVIMD